MTIQSIKSNEAPAPIGPYSQAVWAGDTLYVSGQIAIDQPNDKVVMDNIQDETEQVMKNLKLILTEAGLTFQNVVKCTIFIKNMNDFSKINEIYGKYFDDTRPARETVEVSNLPKFMNVEISCVAVKS